jgi:hypothetical protein
MADEVALPPMHTRHVLDGAKYIFYQPMAMPEVDYTRMYGYIDLAPRSMKDKGVLAIASRCLVLMYKVAICHPSNPLFINCCQEAMNGGFWKIMTSFFTRGATSHVAHACDLQSQFRKTRESG